MELNKIRKGGCEKAMLMEDEVRSKAAKLLNCVVSLPVTSFGQPDFDYMTKYIEMIQASAKRRLQSYQNVVK